jgi:hypothetical protein
VGVALVLWWDLPELGEALTGRLRVPSPSYGSDRTKIKWLRSIARKPLMPIQGVGGTPTGVFVLADTVLGKL